LLRALLDAPEIPNNHLSYALTWFALAGRWRLFSQFMHATA